MRRLVLAIVVSLLTFSASGVMALIVAEPCAGIEQTARDQTARDDGRCAPTCVTCGCCAQAVEPLALQASSPRMPIAEMHTAVPTSPRTQAHDILHVPKPHSS